MASQSSTCSTVLSSEHLVSLSFRRDALLPFLFSCVGIRYQEQSIGSVPLTGGDVLTGRIESSHPCLALWSCFLCHSWLFARGVFWFNCRILDYVIMALEFFIRSFLSWSLGLKGTCFLACDVFEKSGYLYYCSFVLILWLLLWGIFGCAELSFVCICCMEYLGGLLLYWAQISPALFFASWHESGLLLTIF